MRLFKKKGFSLVELVVVIAIMAILAAMILPNLSSSEATKKAVASAATDFYAATQRLLTKYSKYENYLTEQLRADQDDATKSKDCALWYNPAIGGSYPQFGNLVIAMGVDKGKISYVNACSHSDMQTALGNIFGQKDVGTETEFERIFKQEIDPLIEQQDGVYYAIVSFDLGSALSVADLKENYNTVRVLATGYAQIEMPVCTDFSSYKMSNLLFKEAGLLTTGRYFGVCSSYEVGGKRIGLAGSYFSTV